MKISTEDCVKKEIYINNLLTGFASIRKDGKVLNAEIYCEFIQTKQDAEELKAFAEYLCGLDWEQYSDR